MLEFLLIILLAYVGIRIAWWIIKTTLFVGIAALVLGAVFMPWLFMF